MGTGSALAVRPADLQACRSVLRLGSKSFHLAWLLLPSRVRPAAAGVYAFCRVADDAVDEAASPLAGLDGLAHRLDAVFAGSPGDDPVDRAFAAVVEAFGIPKAVGQGLLEGFAWDVEGRRYETLSEVRAYAARVASTVGVMMSRLMGADGREALARACDLGVAMQLTNIARDVGEDARRGRLYLPRRWLVEAGLDPDEWLSAPAFSPALGEVVGRLLGEADRLYERADRGIAMLPRDCRPAIRAARLVYSDIGEQVRRAGLDSVGRRASSSTGRKLWLVLKALVGRSPVRGDELATAPPLEETAFLLGSPRDPAPADARVRAPAGAREGVRARSGGVDAC